MVHLWSKISQFPASTSHVFLPRWVWRPHPCVQGTRGFRRVCFLSLCPVHGRYEWSKTNNLPDKTPACGLGFSCFINLVCKRHIKGLSNFAARLPSLRLALLICSRKGWIKCGLRSSPSPRILPFLTNSLPSPSTFNTPISLCCPIHCAAYVVRS